MQFSFKEGQIQNHVRFGIGTVADCNGLCDIAVIFDRGHDRKFVFTQAMQLRFAMRENGIAAIARFFGDGGDQNQTKTRRIDFLMTNFAFGTIVLMAVDFIWNPEWKNDHPLD